MVDVDDTVEAPAPKLVFVTDKEKAALNGISVEQIAGTLQVVLDGAHGRARSGCAGERNPLRIELRLPRRSASSAHDLAGIQVKGRTGQLVPLAELGRWETTRVDQTIYHKNLQRVAYVFAETAGRPPAECVVDVTFDRQSGRDPNVGNGWVADAKPRPAGRSQLSSRTAAASPGPCPRASRVDFAGEGEWKITLDVFRDLGLAFGAAMLMIYVLLVAQTDSFVVPLVVMLAIPLTILGVMPGFWLLQPHLRPERRRLCRSGLLHGHGHDRHDRPGGHRDPRLDHPGRLHPSVAGPRPVAVRRHHGEPRGAAAADPADRRRGHALEHPDHHRPDLLRPGLVADLRPVRLDLFTLFVIPVTYWLLYAGRTAQRPEHGTAASEP